MMTAKWILITLICGVNIANLFSANIVVGPLSDQMRQEFKLDGFYQKQTQVAGFPILGSAKVSDAALSEAAWILQHMLQERENLLRTMASNHVYLVVMAWNEFTTDLPEQSNMKPSVYWDRRARGLGGNPVSCAEENLLCHPGDPYFTENILIHEFAHVIHGQGLKVLDPTFDSRLKSAYENALERGLWKGTYAATNRSEYWAEVVQSWFDNNRENDALHNHVNTRAELKEYDSNAADLCAEVLGDAEWRYLKPMERPPADRAHLIGYDPERLPRFQWRELPVPERPLVSIQTELGDIELELDTRRAPVTVTNFLHYVHQGLYSDGRFFRTVTLSNQPDNGVKIEVIQAQANPDKEKQFLPAIPIERTRDSGLRHIDGTISMAREGSDTA